MCGMKSLESSEYDASKSELQVSNSNTVYCNV